jgi:dipeptidyl aminopeptidase/acylaminoacyl peptidase
MKIANRASARGRMLSAAVCVFLCSVVRAQVPAPRPDLPPPEDFYKLPAYSDVTLSADGRSLAALIPINNRTNVALVDLEKRSAIALTAQTSDDVVDYNWLGNRIIEASTADYDQTGGVTRRHRHVLIDAIDHNVIRDLQAISRLAYARVLMALDTDGSDLIIETYDRTIDTPDCYHYNATNGRKELLTFRSPGDVREFIADHNGQIRVAVSVPRGGDRTVVSYRKSNDDTWKTLKDEPNGYETFDPIGFDFDDRTLYVRIPNKEKNGQRDVYTYDTETGELGARVFEAHGGVDAGGIVSDWVQRKVVGVRDGSDDGVAWFDPKWKQIQAAVNQALPNAHNRIGWARNNTDRILIASQSDSNSPEYFLLDRKNMSMERVARSRPWLKPDDMSPRERVTYKARDGLPIPAYLTMPKRPDGEKPPLVVVIHGGPFVSGYRFGYDGDSQFFASRGYATLEPNFRGTLGYGAAFEQAGWRQWGKAMQDDVTDGVKWLIDNGKVDPDRVCLFGASYGGYATLWGLEKEPTMFRCGVAFLAVSNLELMFDANWSDFMRVDRAGEMTKLLSRELGDPKDRATLKEYSPVNHADRIQAALLMAYGGTDQRVPIIHGTQMKSAMDDAHKPYEWVVYNEQQHMRFDPVNGADFYRRVDAFLQKNLAPRAKTAALSTAAPASGQP